MMAGQSPLKVGVVGGGIAGLSAAIALKRAGHSVEVSELFFSRIPRQRDPLFVT